MAITRSGRMNITTLRNGIFEKYFHFNFSLAFWILRIIYHNKIISNINFILTKCYSDQFMYNLTHSYLDLEHPGLYKQVNYKLATLKSNHRVFRIVHSCLFNFIHESNIQQKFSWWIILNKKLVKNLWLGKMFIIFCFNIG